MRADAVIVGAGTAGLVTGARLAEAGRRVVVVGKGAGATRLTPGTIDVLGYAPERVEHPADAVDAMIGRRPAHPYGRIGLATLTKAIDWLKDRVDVVTYVGSLEENLLLPTAIGAPRPSAVVPETMVAGDLRQGGSYLLCGLHGFKDFSPALAAENLTSGVKVEARGVELRVPTGGEPEISALGFARRLEDPSYRQAVVREVVAVRRGEDAIGFPAVLGLAQARKVWSALSVAIGVPVFEIPTLPPSVPGIRLFGALEAVLRRAGGRLMLGNEVVGVRTSANRVDAIAVKTSARPVEIEADSVVLATGGFLGGGLELDSRGVLRETVLGLPIGGVPADGTEFFAPGYFEAHPLSRVGLDTDAHLRPIGADGAVVYENVFAAGAVLGGAEPWREKSGEGISLGSGFKVAGEIMERIG